MIEEIYLIHHTHTDIGYTDLPTTTWKLHVQYIRAAMQAIRETEGYPEEARFRWTCESLFMVEQFLQQASGEEREEFAELVARGDIEVTAMPFNITPFLGVAEWQALREHLQPLWKNYAVCTAMQDDINGFSWGLLPSLQQADIRYFWMGMNAYSGGAPFPRPSAFWWEGPTGERLLTWQGYGYGDGYSWFHEQGWRRGPVPPVSDIWFHPPAADEVFGSTPAALEQAYACLQRRLTKMQEYPWLILPLQVTNMWRIDNDPPCRQLSDFVQAWNRAGYAPRLRLATPRQFMQVLEHDVAQQASSSLPVVRGDWPDWWADGSTSTPVELALNQRTKQLLADLPAAARLLSSAASLDDLWKTWRTASLLDEHTWGAYDSVSAPYQPRALGSWMQKMGLAYRSHEEAQCLRAAIIRQSPEYCPASKTRTIAVLNPGQQPRSGWAEISSRTWHEPFNAVRDQASGAILPLEFLPGIEWDEEAEPQPDFFALPDDTWNVVTTQKRFYVANLPAGATRSFELLTVMDLPAAPIANVRGNNGFFAWEWEQNTGRLLSWKDQYRQRELIDAQASYAMGEVVIETPQGQRLRNDLSNRKESRVRFERSSPALLFWKALPCHYAARYLRVWEHPHVHRIEQQWDFLHALQRVEITTTFWLKESVTPQALFLTFPWAMEGGDSIYFSLGYPTRVGHDQLPNSCGEFVAVNEGIEFRDSTLSLALSTLDTPLGVCGALQARNGQLAEIPSRAHYYAYVTQNYWATNFSVTKTGKLVTRHVIQPGAAHESLLSQTNTHLWTFPVAK